MGCKKEVRFFFAPRRRRRMRSRRRVSSLFCVVCVLCIPRSSLGRDVEGRAWGAGNTGSPAFLIWSGLGCMDGTLETSDPLRFDVFLSAAAARDVLPHRYWPREKCRNPNRNKLDV